MSAANGVHALEAEQKTRQRAEPIVRKPVGVKDYEKLMGEAEALVKSGRSADAYTLLEPLEFEHSGEERFDYLIGIAALDSGKPDKATLAFERVLLVNPDSAAARLDMARAYYQLGDLPRAKTEFVTALTQNPSEMARANIEKYLDEIAAQGAGKQTRISGYVEGVLGHDTNVNYSTSLSQVFVDAPASVVTLDPANVKTSDNYYGVNAGGEITRRLNADWGVYAGANLRQRRNSTQQRFDTLGLDARAGVMFGAKADRLRFGILGGQNSLGDARNSDITGLIGEWHHEFSPGNQSNVFIQQAKYRYADVVMQPNDFNQQVIGGNWLHVLASGKSSLFGDLYYGKENDISTLITPATPNGGRSDGAKRLSGLRVGGQTAYTDKMTLFVDAGVQTGNYSKVNLLFLRKRSDRLYDLTMGTNWHWDKLWTLRPQLNYAKNNSNIVIYGYNRIDVSLTIRRDFR